MTQVLDPLFASAETAHQLQLHRYRAEYVLRELWRIYHQRTGWRHVIVRRDGGSGAVVAGAGSMGSVRAAYVDVIVPAASRLEVDEHLMRMWRSSLRAARRTLTADEDFAVEEFLHRQRHAAVFVVEGGGVRRNRSASPDLARAALKLMAAAEIKETDRC